MWETVEAQAKHFSGLRLLLRLGVQLGAHRPPSRHASMFSGDDDHHHHCHEHYHHHLLLPSYPPDLPRHRQLSMFQQPPLSLIAIPIIVHQRGTRCPSLSNQPTHTECEIL